MVAKQKTKAKTHNEYLAALPADQQAALSELRKTIRSAAPKAEECISYQLAAFRHDGKMLVAYGATPSHCAFYLMSNKTVTAHKKELSNYDTSAGTIRFPAKKSLTAALVRKLVKTRIAENAGGQHRMERSSLAKSTSQPMQDEVAAVLAALKRLASRKTRDEMGPRYGVHTEKAFGVPVGKIQQLGKRLGRNHELAAALWETGWYEARMLAAFVDEPQRVTPAQMDRWCQDFDNWGICDTVCFKLFDQVPSAIAFRKIGQWVRDKGEFQKRAAFALLACVALHDKTSGDAPFSKSLPLIERSATDERNFVQKGVSWALRAIGQRSLKIHTQAMATSNRLAASSNAAARWVGKDALRDLSRHTVKKRLTMRKHATTAR